MQKIIFVLLMSIALICGIAGCFKKEIAGEIPKPAGKGKEYTEENVTEIISTDTTWEGVITIDGVVKIAKGALLTILPGTVVEFTYHDYDRDGLGDSGLMVEGGINALGSSDAPVIFTAVDGNKRSGAWGMILINFSNDVIFDYCKFEYSTYTLHIHFSTGSITNSLFTENEDGTRIGRSKFAIYNNVFKGNEIKGVNFTDSKNEIKYNTITENKHGIFLFENDKKSVISYNNIFNNRRYNFKLGDFFIGGIDISNNYWGDISNTEIKKKIYDKKYDVTLGDVGILPLKKRVEEAGIITRINITTVFEYETDGYIDSTAAVDEESGIIYFGSYDGIFYAIDAKTGKRKFKFNAGDVIDSSPFVYGDSVYFASWNKSVFSLDKLTGKLKWEYVMDKSEQDDHRQSSPVVHDGILYIGGYDGTVYALDSSDGSEIWKFKTLGAIRSKGVIDGKTIIFGSSDGNLYGISLKSGRGVWLVDLQSPILAAPLHLGDVIIAAAKNGMLYGIDVKTKTISSRFNNGGVNFYSSPIAYKSDVVFATTDNKLYRLKKYNLTPKSLSNIKGPAYATPIVYRDFLLAPTNSGNLNIIERGAAMRIIKEFTAGNAIQSTPLIYDGKIYFGARDNKFYALQIDVITGDGFKASMN